MRIRFLLATILAAALPASADVKLPAVFGSHMVLQRDAAIPVWGWADAGEAVTVAVAGQTQTVKADANGKWAVTLAPLKLGKPLEMTVSGNTGPKKPKGDAIQLDEDTGATNTLKLTNILVGDVWVCSGQSNMAMSVSRSFDPEKETAAGKYPNIRLFSVNRKVSPVPLTDVEGTWAPCSPETVGAFSGKRICHTGMPTP